MIAALELAPGVSFTADFTWMNIHRGHREHREIIKSTLRPLCFLWLTVFIHLKIGIIRSCVKEVIADVYQQDRPRFQ